jgi:hypothetical protein
MRTCEVRIWQGTCRRPECSGNNCTCEHVRIGCGRPARWKNPFFGKKFGLEGQWWRGWYSYAEYLCAECYDRMVSDAKGLEGELRDYGRFADPEYTKILETL